MIVHAIADLHGYRPPLTGGDLLIIAGDLTANDEYDEYSVFQAWLEKQDYRRKIIVGGNHDNKLKDDLDLDFPACGIEYLCNSGTRFEGLKIWGTPHSLWFDGINPKCKAFTGRERQLRKWYEKIPYDLDILISHGPAWQLNDRLSDGTNVGSFALRDAIEQKCPKVLITGHIHEAAGFCLFKNAGNDIKCYNVSCVDEHYQLKRGAITI